ncbi:MAG: hypothetical protein KA480_06490 [Anaerolineales bacterium]|nr:hypothetical protein [Anaerolineales bacterium]
MIENLSQKQFEKALQDLGNPRGKQAEFLKVHAQSSGRAMTMKRLAEETGYRSWRGMNLQYGILAHEIGIAAGLREEDFPDPNIILLVDFVPPVHKSADNISNSEWILIMKEPFVKALKAVKWI